MLELLAVLAIILLLAVIAGPSLTEMPVERAALLQLRSAIEVARSEAVHKGREVYIAFTDDLADATFESAADYRFNRFALFVRMPDNPETSSHHAFDPLSCRLRALRPWTRIPRGTLLALGSDITAGAETDGPRLLTILDGSNPATPCSAVREFPFPHEGPRTTRRLPFLMFGPTGTVVYPQKHESLFLHLGVVSTMPAGSTENPHSVDSAATAAAHPGRTSPSEILILHPLTGRCRSVATNP